MKLILVVLFCMVLSVCVCEQIVPNVVDVENGDESNKTESMEYIDNSDILTQDSPEIIENTYEDPESKTTRTGLDEVDEKEEKDELTIKKDQIEQKIKDNLLMKSDFIYTL